MPYGTREVIVLDILKTWGSGLGGIATGKSLVAKHIRQLGHLVIDADQVSRLVVEPGHKGLKQILETFGPEVLTGEGRLDRSKMREIIFNNPKAKSQLESILHPLIQTETQSILEEKGLIVAPSFWFYEASLLFEKNRQDDFREIWVTYCDRQEQLQRLVSRDKCSMEQAEKILSSQLPALEKAQQADLVIDTNKSIEDVLLFVTQQLKTRLPIKE